MLQRTVTAAVVAIAFGAAALASAVAAPPVCPQRSPAVPARQGWPPARGTLAPRAATWIRVCRYSGLNDRPPSALTAAALVRDRAEVARIVRRLDDLPAGPSGPVACPMDDGSQITLWLGYRSGHVVTITLGLTGCGIVTNGAVRRTVGVGRSGPALVRELEADAHPG